MSSVGAGAAVTAAAGREPGVPWEPRDSGCGVPGRQIAASIPASARVCQELNPRSRSRLAGGSSLIRESGRTHQRAIKLLHVVLFLPTCFCSRPGAVLLVALVWCGAVVLGRVSPWMDRGVTADTCCHLLLIPTLPLAPGTGFQSP